MQRESLPTSAPIGTRPGTYKGTWSGDVVTVFVSPTSQFQVQAPYGIRGFEHIKAVVLKSLDIEVTCLNASH